MIKDAVKDKPKEVNNSVDKAEDTADRALLKCSENNKHIERQKKCLIGKKVLHLCKRILQNLHNNKTR